MSADARRAVRLADGTGCPGPGATTAGAATTGTALMRHRLYVPPGLRSDRRVPLLVALHGCTQSAADFALGTRFDEIAAQRDAIVLYPEQDRNANPSGCWNWFLPEHQGRHGGEPAAILRLVESIAGRYPVDRDRICVAGLSAGGAMAAILGEQAPDVFSGVAIVAGVALHAGRDLPTAYAAMRGAQVHAGGFTPLPRSAGLPHEPSAVAPLPHTGTEAFTPSAASRRGAAAAAGSGATGSRAHRRMRVMIWTGTDDTTVAPINAGILARQFCALLGLAADRAEQLVAAGGDANVTRWRDATGLARIELWTVPAMAHAWSGGSPDGSHTHPDGPDASGEIFAFLAAS